MPGVHFQGLCRPLTLGCFPRMNSLVHAPHPAPPTHKTHTLQWVGRGTWRAVNRAWLRWSWTPQAGGHQAPCGVRMNGSGKRRGAQGRGPHLKSYSAILCPRGRLLIKGKFSCLVRVKAPQKTYLWFSYLFHFWLCCFFTAVQTFL